MSCWCLAKSTFYVVYQPCSYIFIVYKIKTYWYNEMSVLGTTPMYNRLWLLIRPQYINKRPVMIFRLDRVRWGGEGQRDRGKEWGGSEVGYQKIIDHPRLIVRSNSKGVQKNYMANSTPPSPFDFQKYDKLISTFLVSMVENWILHLAAPSKFDKESLPCKLTAGVVQKLRML